MENLSKKTRRRILRLFVGSMKFTHVFGEVDHLSQPVSPQTADPEACQGSRMHSSVTTRRPCETVSDILTSSCCIRLRLESRTTGIKDRGRGGCEDARMRLRPNPGAGYSNPSVE